jgi:hypothetical protein
VILPPSVFSALTNTLAYSTILIILVKNFIEGVHGDC